MHKELEQGLKFLNEGQIEKAHQALSNFERLKQFSPEDNHYYRFLKGQVLFNRGKFLESLKIAEQDYQEIKRQDKPLFLVDSIFNKFLVRLVWGRYNKVLEDVLLCEKLLESCKNEPPFEVEIRKGFFLFMKGFFLHWEARIDENIELHTKCLDIIKNYELTLSLIPFTLFVLGETYLAKGELDLALDFLNRSLDHSKAGTSAIKHINGITNHHIGSIYYQKNALDEAIEYYKRALDILEQDPLPNTFYFVGVTYDDLIRVLLFKNSFEEAQKSLDHFSQYLEKRKLLENFPWFQLSKAQLLASSSRTRDRAKAEKIMKKIIKAPPDIGINLPVLLGLCYLYFQELKSTNDLEILEDIKPLVDKLISESEHSNSYSLRAQALLLKGKISLLHLNMGDARRFLTEAQQIADSHSLKLLAREISHEHDKLLEQLDGLESYKKRNMTLSERINLASMDETLDLMQGRRTVNAPELVNEEPVLLLILTAGGVLIFSHSFANEWEFDSEIFGGFLGAFNSISAEIFSEGLDRAKFGQHTVLMKNIADFAFCYLFKGQTYIAQQKLLKFVENFQKNISMMDTLNKYNQTSQVIELKDFPFLEGYIREIFANE
ncbi:MAG: tetratricopeptide repeat protein [Promethearchaeota archaeon]|jgi:tetratricopeptide (TPR) repeat protein